MKRWSLRLVMLAAFAAVIWVVWSWLNRDNDATYQEDRPMASAA